MIGPWQIDLVKVMMFKDNTLKNQNKSKKELRVNMLIMWILLINRNFILFKNKVLSQKLKEMIE
jgi:hypothetical protein